MPNTAHKWTPDEEQAAIRLTYEEFEIEFPASGVSRDAYRIRRNKLLRGAEGTVTQLTSSTKDLNRAIANNIKMARSLIRLRHNIEADDELNDAIPRIREALEAQAASGQVTGLGYDELRALLLGS